MGRLKKTATLLGIVSVLSTCCFFCGVGPARAEDSPSKADCVSWTAEAKFVGVAYNHLVHLHSQCEKPATCRVKTDVNPKEERVVLTPGEKKTVLTFRGSPAREFKAQVNCSLQ